MLQKSRFAEKWKGILSVRVRDAKGQRQEPNDPVAKFRIHKLGKLTDNR